MKRSALEIYALAVCFFTVACFAVTLGFGLYDAVQIVAPDFTLNQYQYERFQSNDAYRKQITPCSMREEKEKATHLSEEEVTKKREEEYAVALRAEKHEGAQGLVRMFIIILVDIAVFFVHWRIARRSRESVQA